MGFYHYPMNKGLEKYPYPIYVKINSYCFVTYPFIQNIICLCVHWIEHLYKNETWYAKSILANISKVEVSDLYTFQYQIKNQKKFQWNSFFFSIYKNENENWKDIDDVDFPI